MSVLNVCGHHIGLKQSPSVVFSSSSDLMVEKQPGSDQSSSVEIQFVEGDSKEGEQTSEAQVGWFFFRLRLKYGLGFC